MIRYCEKEFNIVYDYVKSLHNIDWHDVKDWTPISFKEIILYMSDGSVRLCYLFSNYAVRIYDPERPWIYNEYIDHLYNDPYFDEPAWRKNFAFRFGTIMDRGGYTKEFISNLTDISKWSMHKYSRCYVDPNTVDNFSTPGLYNAIKMCSVMKAALHEFYVPTARMIDISKLKSRDEWNAFIDRFMVELPDIAERTVEWYPVQNEEVTARLNDGTYISIDCSDFSTTLIYDPLMETKHNFEGKYYDRFEDYYVDFKPEQDWRYEFSNVLRDLMYQRRISQREMIEQTGVTQAMFSRYMNGRATPNLYIATKMARALGTSLTKFHII